ncbi:MAG: efflux RND transporter periplasmic adaptor subunit [Pelodictyon phaeoclathratiforme]|nr:efflux RND transporter periplasmic adaptor subunit [Pelodictyon phaeoclathratiforme]
MSTYLMKRFFRIPVLIGMCVPLFFSGCGSGGGGKDPMKQGTPALPVMTLSTSDASVKEEYSALLEGKVNVEIRPQLDGTLQKIYVDEGASVKAGQPLFKIDDRVYREQYNSAFAAQHAAEAGLAVAKLEVEKLLPLVQNKVISDIQLKIARANYQASLAAVEQTRASARSAAVNLGYTVIKAPVSGYIGKIPFRIGSLLSQNQSEWLTLLSDVSEIYASFSMSEIAFMRFRQYYPGVTLQEKVRQVSPVSLIMADGSTFSEKGAISTISGQFDQATGSVRIRAVFRNPEGVLRSGNTGKVVIESLSRNVLLVPQAATVELQDKVFVFQLAKDNKVTKRVIVVSAKSGNNYIVSSGVKQGDVIVTAGIEKLQDGALIKPIKK